MAIWLRPQGGEENPNLVRSGTFAGQAPGGGRVLHHSKPADEPGAERTMLLRLLSPWSCQPLPGPQSCPSWGPPGEGPVLVFPPLRPLAGFAPSTHSG